MGKFKKCCAVSNGVPTLEVSIERYEQMSEAEIKLMVLKDVLSTEENVDFGYSKTMSDVIDTILEIKRNEK